MTWAAIVVGVGSTAAGIYAGNKARKAANKRTPAEQLAEQQALQNSQISSQFGADMLGRASGPLTSAQNFWQSVLNGDRSSLMTLYGKEINDLGQQSRTAYRTSAELSPRSGASAETLSSLPFQRAIAERRITSAARPQAASELSSLGTNLASLGFSGLNGGNAAGSSLLSYGQNRREYADRAGADTAQSIYEIIKALGNAGVGAYQSRAGAGAGTGKSASGWWGSTGKAGY